MQRDPLREQLDNAALTARGGRRAKWFAEARAFAEPAWAAVERALADDARDDRDEACDFFASLPAVLPPLSCGAWLDAFARLRGPSPEAVRVIKGLAQRLADEPDIAVALPLMLAGFGHHATLAGTSKRQFAWISRRPWGSAAAVAVLLQDAAHALRDGAFACLGWDRALPTAARGALWLSFWSDPRSIDRAWPVLARLDEPAAIAATLASLFPSHADLSRPALTRALARIVAGDDPWLAARDAKRDVYGWESSEKAVARAVELLPWAARRCGSVDLAREVLAARWSALGTGGAVAWALLGGQEAVPALLEQLGDDDTPAFALAALGPLAADVADAAQARLGGSVAAVVEAALRPTPAALDALHAVIDAGLATFAMSHAQYIEGLITPAEMCGTLRRAAAAVAVWREHGLTSERQAAWTRVREALDPFGDFSGVAWIANLYE